MLVDKNGESSRLQLFRECLSTRKIISPDEQIILLARETLHEANKYSSGTRKLAAQCLFLHNCQQYSNLDFIHLAALVDLSDAKRLSDIVRIWMKSLNQRQISSSNDEFMFLSCMFIRCGKMQREISSIFNDYSSTVYRQFIYTLIVLGDIRTEDISHLYKAVVKFGTPSGENADLLRFLVEDLPYDQLGKYMPISILLNTQYTSADEISPYIASLSSQFLRLVECQHSAGSVAPAVSALFQRSYTIISTQNLFLSSLTSHIRNIRTNAARYWLGRIVIHSESLSLMDYILESCRIGLEEEKHNNWPPYVWETEDISCIDVRWQWKEAEDVFYRSDCLIFAYITTWNVFSHKYPSRRISSSDPLLLAALKWYLPEIRILAFTLFLSVAQQNDNNIIEDFLIANASSNDECEELHRLVKRTAASFQWTEIGKTAYLSTSSNEQKGEFSKGCFVAYNTDLNVPEMIGNTWEEKLECLLRYSGSLSNNQCPSFPEMYKSLLNNNIDQRVYASTVTKLLNTIVNSAEEFTQKINLLWSAITRCRHKAIVDHGCDLIDEMIAQYESSALILYEKAIHFLLSPSTEARTLAVSRVLWSSCSVATSLFNKFWNQLRPVLQDKATKAQLIGRILKTLKLFVSKANCGFQPSVIEFLFWYCIDQQDSSDFLVRSAATILFGFIVKSITRNQHVPLYFITITWPTLWEKLVVNSEDLLSTLNRNKRILILTFFSHLKFFHANFYPEDTIRNIDDLMGTILSVFHSTNDVREKRFCIDILSIWMTSEERTTFTLHMLNREDSNDSIVDKNDIGYTIFSIEETNREFEDVWNKRRIPTDLLISPFVKMMEETKNLCTKWALEPHNEDLLVEHIKRIGNDWNLSHELSAQCAAMRLSLIAKAIGDKSLPVSTVTKSSLLEYYSLLSRHSRPRVRALISQVPLYLRLTKFMQHQSSIDKVLIDWSMSN